MQKTFVNRDNIARTISRQINLPIAQTVRVLKTIEEEIVELLKTKGKVTLKNFGSFYLVERKSRMIRQIRTKKPQLLLPRKVIKLRGVPNFKRVLAGKNVSRQSPVVSSQKFAVKIKKTKPPIQKPALSLKFPPLKIFSQVEREKMQKKVREKLYHLAQKLAREEIKTTPPLKQSPGGRVFIALFKQIKKIGADNLRFSLDEKEFVDIFCSRPQKLIARLPKNIIKQFLKEYLDMDQFSLPQERFALLAKNDKIYLQAHSIPTYEGASIYLKLSSQK
jgi:nucleoid DNA-binding protein